MRDAPPQPPKPARPSRPYTVAEGLAEARVRIAACAREPEGGTLDLGGLSLDDDALAALAPSIAALPPLQRLYLGVHASVRDVVWYRRPENDNKLCNAVSGLPATLLHAHARLEVLDLGLNSIGDDGARALAALTGLTSLDLADNRIGADGARALAALTGLTSLNLAGNRIGDDGAAIVRDMRALEVLA